MSMETHSTKRKRIYKRKFDHDLAIEMAAKGFTAGEIRRHLGNIVSTSAIERVINPRVRKQMDEHTKRYLMSGQCQKCGKARTRYGHTRHDGYEDSGLCRSCWAQSRQTRFKLDVYEDVIAVICTRCRNWFPPEIFPKNREGTRGFHNLCKSCNTQMRSKYREKRKVPCVICGRPCTHPKEKGTRGVPFARCRSCYQDLRSGRRGPIEGEPIPSVIV